MFARLLATHSARISGSSPSSGISGEVVREPHGQLVVRGSSRAAVSRSASASSAVDEPESAPAGDVMRQGYPRWWGGLLSRRSKAALAATGVGPPQYGCAVNEPASAAGEAPDPAQGDGPDPMAAMRQRGFLAVLLLAAIVGVVASAAAFGFLELNHALRPWVYNDLPDALGFDTRPDWWALPVLAIAGLLAAVAIVKLPGIGGHIPANGLNPAPTEPIELPGCCAPRSPRSGSGSCSGPEAPLIAMGGAIGFLVIRLIRRDAPPEVQQVIAACGTFAAVSFLFGSPVIAAVLMIEASGIGGSRLPLVLVPGLLAAGIGSLVSTGLGSWTGVDTSNIAIGTVHAAGLRPTCARSTSSGRSCSPRRSRSAIFVIFTIGRRIVPIASARPFLVLPARGHRRRRAGDLVLADDRTTASTRCCSRARRTSHRWSPTLATFSTGALAGR